MESMTAPTPPVTVGVDSHLDLHMAAVLDHTGRLLGTKAFPASTRGYVALVTWAEGFGPGSASGWKAPAPMAPGWPGSRAPTVWRPSR
jgi:transposase